MSAAVVPLRGEQLDSSGRAAFLAHVAESFDKYVATYGHEPDALLAVFAGIRQPAHSFWLIRGDSEGAANAMLLLGAHTLQAEV